MIGKKIIRITLLFPFKRSPMTEQNTIQQIRLMTSCRVTAPSNIPELPFDVISNRRKTSIVAKGNNTHNQILTADLGGLGGVISGGDCTV